MNKFKDIAVSVAAVLFSITLLMGLSGKCKMNSCDMMMGKQMMMEKGMMMEKMCDSCKKMMKMMK